jgi:hypothetical protein
MARSLAPIISFKTCADSVMRFCVDESELARPVIATLRNNVNLSECFMSIYPFRKH